MSKITIYIKPIGKPRMTQRDRWAKRPCVMRYRAFADQMRAETASLDLRDVEKLSWLAVFALPKSWSKKKKEAMGGKPHRQRPDRDNIDKAILDSLFKDDSGIASGHIEKIWDDGKGERIIITIEPIQ